jgi:hypothetical protein
MGYCSDGWWLNQQFCCWEIEGDGFDVCESWHPWSTVTLARWIIYVTFAVGPFQLAAIDNLLNFCVRLFSLSSLRTWSAH